jgi:polysaccharide biosynthesis/export protein
MQRGFQTKLEGGINMMRYKLFILLTCTIAFITACAPNAVINPVSIGPLDQQARNYPQKEYIIAAGDTLDIKFVHNPEFNELALPVRPDGRISLQLMPDFKIAGMTPSQLRDILMKTHASELKNPDVMINVRTFSDHKVFVDGEVEEPKLIELKGPTTIMTAITQAGGMRETARLSNVILIRKDFEGRPVGTQVDLRKVIDGTDFSQNIYLMPHDIVYVPKSNIARVDKWINEYITQVIPGLAGFNPYYNAY